MPTANKLSAKNYQIKLWLRGLHPVIWRRILVNGNTTIADLHYIIQISMYWSDTYLNCFNIRGKNYGIYHSGGLTFEDDPNEICLNDFNFINNNETISYCNF